MVFVKNSSGDASIIKKLCKDEEFMWGGSKWKVIEALRSDNTEMRRIRNNEGDDEIYNLTYLLKELNMSSDYKLLDKEENVVKNEDTKKE